MPTFITMQLTSAIILCCFVVISFTSSANSLETLANNPTWLKLGHYSADGESYVISDSFFISEQGKRSPKAELAATIEHLNSDPKAQCRFPARYQWLQSQGLKFRQKQSQCNELIKWRDAHPIHSVSLIFASGYMSNPASLYGHMLLKLNRSDNNRNKLLDYSINYGAIVPDNENGLVYIAKGLFGGYEAGFSDQLYYRHHHNYGEVELRDLWEYKLKLTDDKVSLLSNHIWELMGVKYRYYFADENCAYHIARVIELVTANGLTENLSPWVIPGTIFSRLNEINQAEREVIASVSFTPSRSSTFHQYQKRLNAQQNLIAKEIFHNPSVLEQGQFTQLTTDNKKKIIEVLFEFVQLQQLKNVDVEKSKTLKKALVRARLKLPSGNQISIDTYHQKPPHFAQKPSSYSTAYTRTNNEKEKGHFGFRLSYFDVLAADVARVPYSNLEMLDTEFSYTDDNLYVEKLHLLDLQSFNPAYTSWPNEGGWSWQLNVGFERQSTLCEKCDSTFAMGGYGKSMLVKQSQTLLYGMLNGYIGDLANTEQPIDVSLEFGLLTPLYRNWKFRVAVEKFHQRDKNDFITDVEAVIPLQQDIDLRFSYQKAKYSQWQLKFNYYWQ